MNELMRLERETRAGICEFCGQISMVEMAEGGSDLEANRIATEQCNCVEAKKERKKKERLRKASLWAEREFGGNLDALQEVYIAVKAVFEHKLDVVSLKINKSTYKIDLDKDGMIRIKQTFKTSAEEQF